MKKQMHLIIGTLISVGLLAYLFSKTDLRDVITTFKNLSFEYLAFSLGIYLVIMAVRTIRFRLLLSTPISFFEMLKVTSTYSLFSNILPFKAGEFSYVFLSKQNVKLGTGERVMSWFVSRIMDFITLGILFLATYFILNPQYSLLKAAVWVVMIAVAVLSIGLIILVTKGSLFVKIIRIVLEKLNLQKIKVIKTMFTKLETSVSAFSKVGNIRVVCSVFVLSMTIWILQAFWISLTFSSLRLTGIDFEQAVIILLIAGLIIVLPIQGIAGFGTYEAGFTLALVTIGIETNKAITYSIGMHIIQLIFLITTGITSFFLLISESKSQKT